MYTVSPITWNICLKVNKAMLATPTVTYSHLHSALAASQCHNCTNVAVIFCRKQDTLVHRNLEFFKAACI